MRRLTFNGKLMAGHGLFYDASNTVTLTQLSQQLNLDCTSAFELWGIIDLLCSPLWIWNADKLQYSDGLRFPTQSPYSWPNLGSQWPICSKSRVASSCLPEMMNIHSSVRNKIGVIWQNSDLWAKNWNLGPKKRKSFLYSNHVLATSGKSCS